MKNKNISKSIRQKLYNHAVNHNINFNLLLIQFFNERLLFRISKSKYSANLILKGALLFLAHNVGRLRPTKDIDFLGNNISNGQAEIENIFQEIASLNFDDGVLFDKGSISSEIIKEPDEYTGIRLKIDGQLDTARQRLQIDLGFGDEVFPQPELIDFPVILDLEKPVLYVYPLETSIAEKFQAIVSLGNANSRMKDFYDIYYLAGIRNFEIDTLKTALIRTFANRGTDIGYRNLIFSDTFVYDREKEQMWQAFIARSQLVIDLSFKEAVGKIKLFIDPIFKLNSNYIWNPAEWKWGTIP